MNPPVPEIEPDPDEVIHLRTEGGGFLVATRRNLEAFAQREREPGTLMGLPVIGDDGERIDLAPSVPEPRVWLVEGGPDAGIHGQHGDRRFRLESGDAAACGHLYRATLTEGTGPPVVVEASGRFSEVYLKLDAWMRGGPLPAFPGEVGDAVAQGAVIAHEFARRHGLIRPRPRVNATLALAMIAAESRPVDGPRLFIRPGRKSEAGAVPLPNRPRPREFAVPVVERGGRRVDPRRELERRKVR